MFGVSVSIDRVRLCRLAIGTASLVVVAVPAVARADGSSMSTCSSEARQALANIGGWATAQCDAPSLSFAALGSPDPTITQRLNDIGGWAAEAYTAAGNAIVTNGARP